MKAKYIFIGLALACALCACSRDEESLFDKSAAERSQAALDNANAVLVSPANGWEMMYFANTASRGYNIVLKFDANGRVTATAKNSTTTGNKIVTDDNSTWQVKLDYGPLLTFDTYNDVFHAWSDPQNDGDGLLGDYEFLILHADANYVKLKGKKHGGYSYMYPIGESITVEDYFAEVEEMQKKLFANNNILEWTYNGKTRQLHNGQSGLFSLTELGQYVDLENEDIYPIVENRTGIQLSYAIAESEDVFYRWENGKLVSENATISACAPDKYFGLYMRMTGGGWSVNLTDLNPTALQVLNTLDEDIKTKYNNKKKGGTTDISFKCDNQDRVIIAYSYIGSGSKATTYNYFFDLVEGEGSIKLTYNAPADDNGKKIIDAFPELGTLFDLLGGEYTLTAGEPFNPTLGMKLTKQSDASQWLNVTGAR